MKFDKEQLYGLLPAMYRLRDDALKKDGKGIPPLKSLMSVLADEVEHLEENLDQLYDDQFIETCAEWVIPYIGELIGSRPLIPLPDPKFTRRAEVANTISYRRRKGTASIIEQLARDVTNWDTNVIEYFQLLVTTQYLNHLRPRNVAVSSLRNWEELELVNTPFDTMAKTVDVRNIANRRGKYNISNIGIFLWRIKAYSITESPAFKIADFKYTFDPCGMDIPLYNKAIPEKTITQLASSTNVSRPISRRVMKAYTTQYYGPNNKIQIKIGVQKVLENEICIGNLDNWNAANISPTADKVVVDPVLGRIMFGTNILSNPNTEDIIVSYNYGFSADIGGGEYEREYSFSVFDEKRTVSKVAIPLNVKHFNTIQAAIDDLETTSKNGIIEILDNGLYNEDLSLNPGVGVTIEIRAKDGGRPTIKLNSKIQVKGAALSGIKFNGLLIDGGHVEIVNTSKAKIFKLNHCTLIPHDQNNQIQVKSAIIALKIENSIVAGIRLMEDTKAEISNSVIDITDTTNRAIKGTILNFGGNMNIRNSTIIGEVLVKSMILAENVIFFNKVFTNRLQYGCVRFSYLPIESITPKRYKCQPDDQIGTINIIPSFTSLDYGNPAYCQLDEHCVEEITMGAEDESEMGVFHNLFQPQRVANLRTRLDEYLRFGMEAGIFYAS